MREGWTTRKLGEVISLEYGKPLPKEQRCVEGGFPAYGANGVKCYAVEPYWESPSIIVGRKGTAGAVTLVEGGFWPLDVTYYVTFDDSKCDRKFIYFMLSSLNLPSLATGVKPGINRNIVYGIKKKFPPFVEQKRIVAILDEAFEGIDTVVANTEKNLTNARELLDSTSLRLFEAVGDQQRFTLHELLELGWIMGHLDGNHGSDYPRKSEFVSEGVPYISANCIKSEAVDFSSAKYLSPDRAAGLRKGVARNRDVLFAHNATVGPVAMLYTDLDKVVLSTSLTYYRCDDSHILPEYLANYMRTPFFKRQYQAVMTQSTRNQVPITKQREFYHLIPSLEEQKVIAGKLDALRGDIEHLARNYRQKLTALVELKQSLLHKAFSGELTAREAEAAVEQATA